MDGNVIYHFTKIKTLQNLKVGTGASENGEMTERKENIIRQTISFCDWTKMAVKDAIMSMWWQKKQAICSFLGFYRRRPHLKY